MNRGDNQLDNYFACDPDLIAAYRRLRALPPETDADGCITWAEIERMKTGPVLGVQHLRRTPEDDPWYVR